MGSRNNLGRNERLSRQDPIHQRGFSPVYHEHKEETILVLSGRLELVVSRATPQGGMQTLILEEGDTFHVRPYVIHRFCATQGTDVRLAEVSTNYLEDVVRVEDDFNR